MPPAPNEVDVPRKPLRHLSVPWLTEMQTDRLPPPRDSRPPLGRPSRHATSVTGAQQKSRISTPLRIVKGVGIGRASSAYESAGDGPPHATTKRPCWRMPEESSRRTRFSLDPFTWTTCLPKEALTATERHPTPRTAGRLVDTETSCVADAAWRWAPTAILPASGVCHAWRAPKIPSGLGAAPSAPLRWPFSLSCSFLFPLFWHIFNGVFEPCSLPTCYFSSFRSYSFRQWFAIFSSGLYDVMVRGFLMDVWHLAAGFMVARGRSYDLPLFF